MKKFSIILLAGVLCLGLAACSGTTTPVANPTDAPEVTQSVEVTPVPDAATEAPVETETPAETEAPADVDFTRVDVTDTLNYDIDGDGAEETIALVLTASEGDNYMDNAKVTVSRDGTELDSYTVEYFYNTICFIDDLTASDSYKEIFLCGDMGSDDYETFVLRLVNGKLVQGSVYGTVLDVTEGTIHASMGVDILGTYGAEGDYTLADDATLTFNDPEVYTIMHSASQDEYNLTVLKALPVQLLNGETWEDGTLEANTKLKLASTDRKTWCICEAEDGRTVKILGSKVEDVWEWQIAGEPESNWISGMVYAG